MNALNSLSPQDQAVAMAYLAGMKAKEGGLHTKTPANFSTYTPLHGLGGIWAGAGLEREIINASMRPQSLLTEIPAYPSNFLYPQFGILTGFTGMTGSQPTNVCGDAPTGYVKGCNLTARFGVHRYDTNTIEVDELGMRLHRGDFTDLVLYGQVTGLTSGIAPGSTGVGDILNNVLASEMTIVGVAYERELARQAWQGVTTVAGEFPGLAVQVNTGQVDADTGTACPAADSDVKDFAYDLVCSSSGRDIVEYMGMLEYYIRNNAMGMGLMPVEWVWVMRPQLWHELTKCWPCAAYTSQCSNVIRAGGQVFIDGRENALETARMREQKTISVNGNDYRVILDDGIAELTNINDANVPAGTYASSIYFLPLKIIGGLPVLYRQFIDYRVSTAQVAALNSMGGGLNMVWTDGGQYLWAFEQTKYCFKLAAKTEQRIVLRAPHLAGRIDHVRYAPLQRTRESIDTTSPYFQDGGVSLRANNPGLQAVWLS